MSKTKTIHAYAAHENGSQLERFAYEASDLAPDDLEIDVLYCGTCHSDLSMIDNAFDHLKSGNARYRVVLSNA